MDDWFWPKAIGLFLLAGGLIALAAYLEQKAYDDCMLHHGWWHIQSWIITKHGATPVYGCDYPPR